MCTLQTYAKKVFFLKPYYLLYLTETLVQPKISKVIIKYFIYEYLGNPF